MTADVFTWVGRVWAALFIVLVASILLAALVGRLHDWRQRRRDVRRVKAYTRVWGDPVPLVPTRLMDELHAQWVERCRDVAQADAAAVQR